MKKCYITFRILKGKCTRSGGIQNSQSTLYNSLNSFTLLPGADEWGRRVLYSARLPHLRVYASKRRCLFEASAPCPAACGRAATLRLRAKSFLRRARRRKKRIGSFLRLPNRELCETEKTVPNQRFGTVFYFFLDFSAARRVCGRCSTRSATERPPMLWSKWSRLR